MKLIVKALNKRDVKHPVYGHILEDTISLALGFFFFFFLHVKRLGNSVARYLARQAKFGEELQVWMESITNL